ncbi:MAG: transporter permease [Marmoricola sp.]|nr:transporter permease [Marmoricola sp.]
MRANFVLSGVATGIRRNATMTIAIVLSTAIALGFVGAAILANFEITKFRSTYEGELHVQVYLCTSTAYDKQVSDIDTAKRTNALPRTLTCAKGKATTQVQTDVITQLLKTDPSVKSFTYLDQQKNLEIGKKQQPALKDFLKLGYLPATFSVSLKDIKADYPAFAAKFDKIPGVDAVNNQIATIDALLSLIDSARLFAIVIAVVVLVASILLIGNTIQVAANQRRNETSIMRLVGASRWMTELPFMLETVIASILGGIIAVVFVAVGKYYLLDVVLSKSTTSGTIPNLNINEVLIAGGAGMITGILLSALTAFVTLRFYVRL